MTWRPATHLVEDDRARRGPVVEDPTLWVRNGRSHIIERFDPETGELVARGRFVNRTVMTTPMPVPADAKGAWFDRSPREALIIDWEPVR